MVRGLVASAATDIVVNLGEDFAAAFGLEVSEIALRAQQPITPNTPAPLRHHLVAVVTLEPHRSLLNLRTRLSTRHRYI